MTYKLANPKFIDIGRRVRRLRRLGMTYRAIAAALGVSHTIVEKHLARKAKARTA